MNDKLNWKFSELDVVSNDQKKTNKNWAQLTVKLELPENLNNLTNEDIKSISNRILKASAELHHIGSLLKSKVDG